MCRFQSIKISARKHTHTRINSSNPIPFMPNEWIQMLVLINFACFGCITATFRNIKYLYWNFWRKKKEITNCYHRPRWRWEMRLLKERKKTSLTTQLGVYKYKFKHEYHVIVRSFNFHLPLDLFLFFFASSSTLHANAMHPQNSKQKLYPNGWRYVL